MWLTWVRRQRRSHPSRILLVFCQILPQSRLWFFSVWSSHTLGIIQHQKGGLSFWTWLANSPWFHCPTTGILESFGNQDGHTPGGTFLLRHRWRQQSPCENDRGLQLNCWSSRDAARDACLGILHWTLHWHRNNTDLIWLLRMVYSMVWDVPNTTVI